MAEPPQPLTAAEWDERERRLDADIADARKALNAARAWFDRLCEERREMRLDRQQTALEG